MTGISTSVSFSVFIVGETSPKEIEKSLYLQLVNHFKSLLSVKKRSETQYTQTTTLVYLSH